MENINKVEKAIKFFNDIKKLQSGENIKYTIDKNDYLIIKLTKNE